MDHKKKYK